MPNPPINPEPAEQVDVIEDNASANSICSMLWVWKYINKQNITPNNLSITLGTGLNTKVGGFLSKGIETITIKTVKYKFYHVYFEEDAFLFFDSGYSNLNYDNHPEYKSEIKEFSQPDTEKQAEDYRKNLQSNLGAKKTFTETTIRYNKESGESTTISTFQVEVRKVKIPNTNRTITTDSPIDQFENFDACWTNTEPRQFYLRFGALLEYITNDVLPKINTDKDNNPPIFDIDFDTYTNYMYSLPNQISLDPRVCIVRNNSFQKAVGVANVFQELQIFRPIDGGSTTNTNVAYQMNIYLNFEFIIESLTSNADERGDVNVYDFLKSVCDGLNKSLGGVNNLEPTINENNNTVSITDTTPIPGFLQERQNYTLQLYGYNKTGNSSYISNFVRKVDLKTAITPEYATMITVGATAGGYVKGTESTAFSKWNVGLVDRFKENFIPGNSNSLPAGGIDEALTNYTNKFISVNKSTACYGYSGYLVNNPPGLKISTEAIESNLSVVTEYYKYLIASQQTKSGGTIGFIPFKISFTMDGISGIKIYNKLNVDTRFLPKAYGDNLNLIVTGVSHKLSNNDWETDIEATVIPKTEGSTSSTITSPVVVSETSSSLNPPINGELGYPQDPNDLKLIALAGGIPPYILLPNGQIKVKTWPNSLRPGDAGYSLTARHFFEPNPNYPLVSAKIPYGSSGKYGSVLVHKDLAAKINVASSQIVKAKLTKYIISVDAGFVCRNVTNGVRSSHHAFGFAIDLNTTTTGCKWDQGFIFGKTKNESKIVLTRDKSGNVKTTQLMGEQEFGYWKVARWFSFSSIGWYYRKDAMHFSINEGLSTSHPAIPLT